MQSNVKQYRGGIMSKKKNRIAIAMLCILCLLLPACQVPNRVPQSAGEQEDSPADLHEYSFYQPAGEGVVVYYALNSGELYQAGSTTPTVTTWCYPVSLLTAADSFPEAAVNLTLQSICEQLGLEAMGLTLHALSLDDATGLATLDLPGRIRDRMTGQSKRLLEALLYTLTEFAEVEQVQLLFDGRKHSMITLSDLKQFDVSLPLERPRFINDDTYYSGQGRRVTCYLQLGSDGCLVPVTQIVEQNLAQPEELFRFMLEPQTLYLRLDKYFSIDLQGRLSSPLLPYWQDQEPPSFSLREGLLQISLQPQLVERYLDQDSLAHALIALTRTYLELPDVQRVQFLVGDRAMPLSFGLFSLADPIEKLPFINIVS